MVGARGRGREGEGVLNGTESQSGKMSRCWGRTVETVVKHCQCAYCPELRTQRWLHQPAFSLTCMSPQFYNRCWQTEAGPRWKAPRPREPTEGLHCVQGRARAQGSLGSRERGMTGSWGPRGWEKGTPPLAGASMGAPPQGRQDSAKICCASGDMRPRGAAQAVHGWGVCVKELERPKPSATSLLARPSPQPPV